MITESEIVTEMFFATSIEEKHRIIAEAQREAEVVGWERGLREALEIVKNNAAYWERQGHFEARDAVWSATKELETAIDARKAK